MIVCAVEVRLTPAGREDPVFGQLPERFLAPIGHQDCVTHLPPGAIVLASIERTENQAFRIESKPIYCTQFHRELNRTMLSERLQTGCMVTICKPATCTGWG